MFPVINKRQKYFSPAGYSLLLCLLFASGLGSCKKFLDQKANSVQIIPSSLSDAQTLLNNYFITTSAYTVNEQSADNYYLTYTNWNSLVTQDRDVYTWAPQADMKVDGGWSYGYQKILYANTSLETVAKNDSTSDPATWSFVKGQGLFFRAFSFYMMAQIWAAPYVPATAQTDLGIPLRLSSDISVVSVRASVQQTYDQIIADLTQAAALLPANPPTSIVNKAQPNRCAAYAALARVYLSMADYTHAALYADSSLNNYNTLMDYNQLDHTLSYPIITYNMETILEASGLNSSCLQPAVAKVDSNLYASYDANDLRKTIFFKQNTGVNINTYLFRGSYDATSSSSVYCGLATDEMYLTRAECYARAGNATAAMTDLNTLLATRWKTGTYTTMTATDADDALSKILTERRKELLFRGLRWTDLRRLNREPSHAVTLTRMLNGTTYTLPPNDLRYTMLIPINVLKLEPMPQNPR